MNRMFWHIVAVLIVGILGIFAYTTPLYAAHGPVHCAPYDLVTVQIDQKFQERRLGVGILNESYMLEIYANEVTGTWTILRVDPLGQACIMAVGDAWSPQSVSND